MTEIATSAGGDSIARAAFLYLTLVSGFGRAVAFTESIAGRTDDPGAPVTDPNAVTHELDAYEFGRMAMDTAHVNYQTLRWPAQALAAILAAAGQLTIGGAGRREQRLRWIETELQAVGSSLDEARTLAQGGA